MGGGHDAAAPGVGSSVSLLEAVSDPRGNEHEFCKGSFFCLGLVTTCSQGIAQIDENKDNKIVFQDGSTYDNDFRVWSTAESEFTVVAKFDSLLNADVVRLIRKDTGKVIDVRISILAPDDRELLKKIRKDIALKMLPNSKEASLERDKLGIEELFRLEKEHRAKTSAINGTEDLLSLKKASWKLLRRCTNESLQVLRLTCIC